MADVEIKGNASFLLPLSRKRWVEETARDKSSAEGKTVSTAEVVREILEAARETAKEMVAA